MARFKPHVVVVYAVSRDTINLQLFSAAHFVATCYDVMYVIIIYTAFDGKEMRQIIAFKGPFLKSVPIREIEDVGDIMDFEEQGNFHIRLNM